MSSALAIAAVTAALKDLLNDGLLNHDLSPIGSFSVTALPPDRVEVQNEPNQLNLFLYQVTPNLGWRNHGLPSRDSTGVRLNATPLALDLHYLLTAYGSKDFNAEILLGYAMQLLHETPVLTRAQLRTVLGGVSPVDGSILPGPFGSLSALDLADQVEMIKITPVYLNTEDLSKMWTAMQARYRTTVAYMVSVVLIQVSNAGKAPLPVLKRGKDDTGPVATAAPFPTLAGVRSAISDLLPAIRLGDDLVVTGSNLDQGTLTAIFQNAKAGATEEITHAAQSSTKLTVHIPSIAEDADAMNKWAAGLYTLALRVAKPNLPVWTTNSVPVALAPIITVNPLIAGAGTFQLTVTCTPRLRPMQEPHTSLIFGTRAIPPKTITTPNDPKQPTTIVFEVTAPVGEYVVRLRVEGIDSIPVTITGPPPKFDFDPQQKVTVT